MLYYLHLLGEWFSPLRVMRYVTVRAVAGAGTAFLLSLVFGPWVIARLRSLQIRQYERREEAPPLYVLHAKKEGTPTMGGVLIIGSVCVSAMLWAVPGNPFVGLVIATMCAMGLVGFLDDNTKRLRKRSKGLTARTKLALQITWSAAIMAALLYLPDTRERVCSLMVPFLKEPAVRDMGIPVAFLFVALVLVGCTNAVNLTDGLDGLAIGCTGSVAFSYLFLSYAAGHYVFAEYLRIPFVRGSGELAVFCGCLLGACLGFLWYNCHPAQVFMGDTGSLALGGALAMVAILIKQEVLLMLVGGVFVVEAVSVILQVAYFKWRGKRIFAMAPIHHHFQMKQWKETQVTTRFWIVSIILALLGVLTLKIR
ncbi:MAG: phospho-N-acetylmuramoyl-pentapeptide-transferase [Lentisphaerae bacterium]|nr:phospho-N-acetylmuramoyl-pentapeptide-transferase [Lentisphaerota bacterium]